MQFVKLHDDGGHPVFINPEVVERVVRRGTHGGGSVVYVAGLPVHVEEPPEKAAQLIEERAPWRDVPPTKMPSHGVPR
jgi:hypothetical protein